MDTAADFLNERSYLTPAIQMPGLNCTHCRGGKNGSYETCYTCGHKYRESMWPDALGFGIFARADRQSGSVMQRYKGSQHSQEHRNIVRALAVLGMWRAQQNFNIDAVTFVPSLRGRQGSHPLEQILKEATSKLEISTPVENFLTPNPNAVGPREYRPENFHFDTGAVREKSVLIVDDTWTSGGHMLSAIGALRAGGADRVYALALARWLDRDNRFSEEEIMKNAFRRHKGFENHKFF